MWKFLSLVVGKEFKNSKEEKIKIREDFKGFPSWFGWKNTRTLSEKNLNGNHRLRKVENKENRVGGGGKTMWKTILKVKSL